MLKPSLQIAGAVFLYAIIKQPVKYWPVLDGIRGVDFCWYGYLTLTQVLLVGGLPMAG